MSCIKIRYTTLLSRSHEPVKCKVYCVNTNVLWTAEETDNTVLFLLIRLWLQRRKVSWHSYRTEVPARHFHLYQLLSPCNSQNFPHHHDLLAFCLLVWYCVFNYISLNLKFFFIKINCSLYLLNCFDVLIIKMIFKK